MFPIKHPKRSLFSLVHRYFVHLVILEDYTERPFLSCTLTPFTSVFIKQFGIVNFPHILYTLTTLGAKVVNRTALWWFFVT